jgi:hypothetical protein
MAIVTTMVVYAQVASGPHQQSHQNASGGRPFVSSAESVTDNVPWTARLPCKVRDR